MPAPDLRNVNWPFGPYRNAFGQDISTADYTNEMGFTVSAGATAVTLIVRALDGNADVSFAVEAGAAVAGPGGIPVACRAVRANATAGTVLIGIL